MKKISLVLMSIVFLSGCSVSNDSYLDQKIACNERKQSITDDVASNWSGDSFPVVKEVFYSNKVDSCLYTLAVSGGDTVTNSRGGSYSLIDALTNKDIFYNNWCTDGCAKSKEEAEEEFYKEVKKYE